VLKKKERERNCFDMILPEKANLWRLSPSQQSKNFLSIDIRGPSDTKAYPVEPAANKDLETSFPGTYAIAELLFLSDFCGHVHTAVNQLHVRIHGNTPTHSATRQFLTLVRVLRSLSVGTFTLLSVSFCRVCRRVHVNAPTYTVCVLRAMASRRSSAF
jgi:hypothetical protein